MLMLLERLENQEDKLSRVLEILQDPLHNTDADDDMHGIAQQLRCKYSPVYNTYVLLKARPSDNTVRHLRRHGYRVFSRVHSDNPDICDYIVTGSQDQEPLDFIARQEEIV